MKSVSAECSCCQATGLYRGGGEQDYTYVVCLECKGSGQVEILYNHFTGRRERKKVKRVHEKNPGICIDADPKWGGMTYEDWLKGESFKGKENRESTCPKWWDQSAVKWEKCSCVAGDLIRNCKHFKNKEECWKRWDDEQERGREQ